MAAIASGMFPIWPETATGRNRAPCGGDDGRLGLTRRR